MAEGPDLPCPQRPCAGKCNQGARSQRKNHTTGQVRIQPVSAVRIKITGPRQLYFLSSTEADPPAGSTSPELRLVPVRRSQVNGRTYRTASEKAASRSVKGIPHLTDRAEQAAG